MANTQINIDANGTKTLAAAGKYCDRNVDVNVNVPIPSDYIKPTGTKSITANGEHDVTSYAKANVNVPIPDGYIKPTGTKSITTNGTHDVTSYASAQVNVPVGITPSGTKEITENGTHDVTDYASAIVNVPSKIEVRDITISSTLGNGTNSIPVILTADPFVKANYDKDGFAVLVVPKTPIAGAGGYVVHSIYHGNLNIGSTGAARYGFVYASTSATAVATVVMTAKISGAGYNVSLRAASNGNLSVYVANNRIMQAGEYRVILMCFE